LASAAWYPTLRLGFIWDDHYTIEANAALHSWSWNHIRHDFQTGLFNDPQGADFYRPLVALASRVDYSLYGLHAWGYHLSNLIFHVLNSLLVWFLFLRIGFPARVSFLVAAFFAVHPLNVQDMLMVTGRCGLLGLLFSLTTLLLLLRPERWALALSVLTFSMALLAKESAFMTPLLFLAIVFYQRNASLRPVLWRLGLLGLMSIIYLFTRPAVGAMWPAHVPLTLWMKFMVYAFPKILVSYAKLTLIPILLYSDRLVPSGSHWLFFTCGVGILGGWLWLRSARWPFFCFCWILAALLPPTAVMVSKSLIHDHWAYPALPGFLLPIAMGIDALWNSSHERWHQVAKGVTVLLLGFWLTMAHLHVAWRGTNESFFRWSARFSASEAMQKNHAAYLAR